MCDSDIRRGKNVLLIKLILSVVHYLIFIFLSLWILWKSGHRSTMASINWTRWLFALIELNSVCVCVCVCETARERTKLLPFSRSNRRICLVMWLGSSPIWRSCIRSMRRMKTIPATKARSWEGRQWTRSQTTSKVVYHCSRHGHFG